MEHSSMWSRNRPTARQAPRPRATAQEVSAAFDERERRFAEAQGFKAEAGRHLIIPDSEGNICRVLFGLGDADSAERDPLIFGKLATALPTGNYRLESADRAQLAALAFALA